MQIKILTIYNIEMKEGKHNMIINPVSGRWVLRRGAIGKKLLQQEPVFTSRAQYNRVTKLWNWWSQCSSSERQKVARSKSWNTMLNDQTGNTNVYPFYLKSYQTVLENAYKILHKK